MLIYALTDTGFAFLIKTLTDSFVDKTSNAELNQLKFYLPVAVIVIFFIRGVSGFFSVYNIGWIGRQVIKALRTEVFLKFLYVFHSYMYPLINKLHRPTILRSSEPPERSLIDSESFLITDSESEVNFSLMRTIFAKFAISRFFRDISRLSRFCLN